MPDLVAISWNGRCAAFVFLKVFLTEEPVQLLSSGIIKLFLMVYPLAQGPV